MSRVLIDKKNNVFKDDFGRAICVENKDFLQYCNKKNMTIADLLKLSPTKREEFFLKWKHGLNDPHVNKEIEYAVMAEYHKDLHMQIADIDPYFQDSVINRRAFESYCAVIKKQLQIN